MPLLGVVLGLGFLTKGPIAVLLPGLLALAVLRRRGLRGVQWPWAGGRGRCPRVVRAARAGLVRRPLSRARQRSARVVLPAREPGALQGRDLRRGPARLVLPAHLLRRGAAVVASAGRPRALLRSAAAAPRAVARCSSSCGRCWAAAAVPVEGQARLLPAAAVSRGRHSARRGTWWRATGTASPRAWAGGLVLLVEAAALLLVLARPPQDPREWSPGPRPSRARGRARGGARRCSSPRRRRPTRRVPSSLPVGPSPLQWLCLRRFSCRPSAAQPNAALTADVARERRYLTDACTSSTATIRPAPSATCCSEVRLPADTECDLWASPARAAVPAAVTPARGQVLPRRRGASPGRALPDAARDRARPGRPVLLRAPERDRPRRQLRDYDPAPSQEEARVRKSDHEAIRARAP